jgi:PTH2 family peptidyl-tRNA hydrolase
MPIKQVIIIRKDLKMRRGKECAQTSHATVSFLANRIRGYLKIFKPTQRKDKFLVSIALKPVELAWVEGNFKKVVLQVNSEEELREYHQKALEAGLESHLIIDAGLTEFSNIPTPTCIAIGPDESDKIDKITGHLKLY